ncbi:hypothetical protein ACVWWN_004211 [Mycobacterium sp. URHB0021]
MPLPRIRRAMIVRFAPSSILARFARGSSPRLSGGTVNQQFFALVHAVMRVEEYSFSRLSDRRCQWTAAESKVCSIWQGWRRWTRMPIKRP